MYIKMRIKCFNGYTKNPKRNYMTINYDLCIQLNKEHRIKKLNLYLQHFSIFIKKVHSHYSFNIKRKKIVERIHI